MAGHGSVDLLQAVRPFLPRELVSRESFAGMLSVASVLAAVPAEKLVFECVLAPGAAAADFSICVAAPGAGPAILAGSHGGLAPEIWTVPAWRRVRAFSQVWADPASLLHRAVHSVWLELDRPSRRSATIPVPSFFFGSDSLTPEGLLAALEPLAGDLLTPDGKRALLSCIERLPAGAKLFQAGVMLGREPAVLRICVEGLDAAGILSYLDDLDGPFRGASLGPVLDELSGLADDLCIDLDIGDHLGPKLGLECFFTSSYAPRLRHFLDVMAGRGLCGPEKRRVLLAYPGFLREEEDEGMLGITSRTVSHFKVIHEPEQALAAKAYLSVKRSRLPVGEAWLASLEP